MSLHVDLALRRGAFELELAFVAPRGQVLGVLGPNGAGKSTLLEAIAGLVPISRGEIVFEDRTLERVSAGVRLPPGAREVGMLFQGLALFEHLSVLDNVAYGPRARGLSKAGARELARAWLERLGITALADRRVRELSGGQAQRVALARALIVEPRLLLLDEPFAALDARASVEARELLTQVLGEFDGVSLVVTHALDEALPLVDRLLVIEGGRLVQDGSPTQIIAAPATAHLRAMIDASKASS